MRWIRFEACDDAKVIVRVAALREDTSLAAQTSATEVQPAILRGDKVAFDFSNIEICTQSFLHALLYDAVRLAWARRTVMHAVHAAPAVQSGAAYPERYALSG